MSIVISHKGKGLRTTSTHHTPTRRLKQRTDDPKGQRRQGELDHHTATWEPAWWVLKTKHRQLSQRNEDLHSHKKKNNSMGECLQQLYS